MPARSDDYILPALLNELKKLNGRASAIEDRLSAIEFRLNRVRQQRYHFLNKIKQLQVEKQGLLNYSRELETFLQVQRKEDKG